MSYTAFVARVRTRPHPNADRLQVGTCLGNQVVIGLDVQDGELGVFFPCDGQLSEAMCEANDLIGYVDAETGERKGGFFDYKRRVKSQKFRGEKSDGYWTSLKSFEFTGADLSILTEGEAFSELNGVPICQKYFTPATLRAMKGGMPSTKKIVATFPEHVETEKFRFVAGTIPEGSIIYITEKVHGTSGRLGHVMDEDVVPLSKWKAMLNKVGFRFKPETVRGYRYLNGTRRTILEKKTTPGFYGNEEFRERAVEGITLHKDEVIYFELVGYTTTGQTIMAVHNTADMKDKAISKEYGDKMVYTYGCVPPDQTYVINEYVNENGNVVTADAPSCRLFVYRITRVNEDGHAVELSWPQVVARCGELGLKTVPEVRSPYYYSGNWAIEELLRAEVESESDGRSTIDPRHVREGVVLRIETPGGETRFVKSKGFTFSVLEGIVKESEDYVDTEEAA